MNALYVLTPFLPVIHRRNEFMKYQVTMRQNKLTHKGGASSQELLPSLLLSLDCGRNKRKNIRKIEEANKPG